MKRIRRRVRTGAAHGYENPRMPWLGVDALGRPMLAGEAFNTPGRDVDYYGRPTR
ncbi:MAG: hypothetical protein ACTMIR_05365 [Cellulomonadaceae bacterium]